MVDTLLGYPHENPSPTLRKRLYVLFKSLEGHTHTSPKNKLTRMQSQPYLISHVDTEKKALVIRQNVPLTTYLHYWRFLHVVDMLNNSQGKDIQLESSYHPKYDDTVEGSLHKRARDVSYASHRLKTALFVCDVLALGGFCEYVSIVNPRTTQRVIGIRKL